MGIPLKLNLHYNKGELKQIIVNISKILYYIQVTQVKQNDLPSSLITIVHHY